MSYICLLPYGDMGWHPALFDINGKNISAAQYYASRLMVKTNEDGTPIDNPLFLGGRLFQQYLCDQYSKIECNSLS